jgi:hypothetical protein
VATGLHRRRAAARPGRGARLRSLAMAAALVAGVAWQLLLD